MLPHSQLLRSIITVLWLACIVGFSVEQRTFEVVENSGENTEIGRLHQSGGEGYGFNDSCGTVFSIDSQSVIRSIGNLDRELVVSQLMTDHPNCIVRYRNTSTNTPDFVVVNIFVLDENDETPYFFNLNQPHRINITENIAVPNQAIRLEAVDNDKGVNGTVVFAITGGDNVSHPFFKINHTENGNSTHGSQFLFLQRELDFEDGPTSFNLSITLRDLGSPVSRTSNQVLLITVLDSNDAIPMFGITTFQFEIFENHTIGPQNPIGAVSISNSHELTPIYSICTVEDCPDSDLEAFDHFAVATDGAIYLTRKLDFEQESMREMEFHVQATNPSLESRDQARVLVSVLNSNDEPPHFECSHPYDSTSLSCPGELSNADGLVFHIEEHSEANLPLYLPVFRIIDEDSDSAFKAIDGVTGDFHPTINGITVYLQLGSSHFTYVSINQTIDREEMSSITLSLTATNSAPPFLSGTAVIQILVDDKNDNAPVFNTDSFPSHIRISESTPDDKEILTVTASDSDMGENATVMYAIEDASPNLAREWFNIHYLTGVITTRGGGLNYAVLDEGTVVLTVSATDNGTQPLQSNVTITISLSPSVSFTKNSFQEYAGYTPLNADGTSLYLEFKTQQMNSLLLYQHGKFALTVEEGAVHYRGFEAVTERSSTLAVSDDRWYSVLLERSTEGVELTVQIVEGESAAAAAERLLDSTLSECRRDGEEDPSSLSLYLGGVDIFLVDPEPMLERAEGFMGSVRNLLIDATLIDLGCPSREENIIQGMYSNPGGCEELACSPVHTTGCVPFAPEPYCSCQGGFTSQACSTENSYAPIRFDGDSKAGLTLDYSFFYDLELNSETVSPTGPGAEDNDQPAGGSVQRRKRQDDGNNGGEDDTIQVVDMSFRVLEPRIGTLLYSKTRNSASVLKISHYVEGTNQATISYEVYDSDYLAYEINFSFQVELKLKLLYFATLTITNSSVTLSISNGGSVLSADSSWKGDAFRFAEPPSTDISIGGASDNMFPSSHFTGCISRVAVNNIELPLSGLLMAEDGGGFTTDTGGTVAPFCKLCDVVTCTRNETTCKSDMFGEYQCACLPGTVLVNDSCVSVTTIATGLQPQDEVSLPIYYIVVIAAGGLVLIGTFIFILICLVHYKKRKRRKSRVYRVTNGNDSQPARSSTKPNPYTNVVPRPEPSLSTLARCGSSATRNSSVSTSYQENDGAHEGTESENTPSHFTTRRKSTTSAESGIKTDTDREDQSTAGLQSGNEGDSEILSSASESEGFTTSGMETALSPSGVLLVGGSSECIMGVPVMPPLTPKERKAITPLRPSENANLSMSEYDTDIETDLSYDIHAPMASSRHESVATDNPQRRNSDSDNSTKVSEAKWYKSSTASDNERERERAMRSGAYYSPQRSYPPNQPRAPEYRPPPKFQEQKRLSPSHHNNSPRPYVNMVASPLTNNTHKYDVLYPNSPKRHDPPRMLFHPHTSSSPSPTHNTPDTPRSHSVRYSQQRTPTHYNAHRQTSLSSSRPVYYNVVPGDLPSPVKYPRSFSNEQEHPRPPLYPPQEQMFQDLKSVATINPIAYWEMQDRMKSEVDQVDPYQILSESYVQFEDVSTDPSVIESQTTIDMPSMHHHHHHHHHQEFSCQGGREGGADIDPLEISMSSQLQDDDTAPPPGSITHFPSADCSEEYVTHTESSIGTLVGSSSDGSVPNRHSNGYVIPSQESFDV